MSMHIEVGNLNEEQLTQVLTNRGYLNMDVESIVSVHPRDVTGDCWMYEVIWTNDDGSFEDDSDRRGWVYVTFDYTTLALVGEL